MNHIFTLLLMLGSLAGAFAQTGSVTGRVYDAQRNEPLIGATVLVNDNPQYGAFTDMDGRYTVANVPVGEHKIVVKYVSYNIKEIGGVVVKAGESATVDAAMEAQASQLQQVVITSTRTQESINSMLVIQKNSAVVQDGVSADLIRRSPDRNTGDVLKRIAGTTIQDGKFAVIRGLGDKYNNAMLNGTPLPSTEPDRKNFSFDLIPANMLESVVIVKTAQPDLPGDFAGGIIQQNLKDVPEKSFLTLSAGGGFHANTTFKDFTTFNRGRHAWLGMDDGTQQFPSAFPTRDAFYNNDLYTKEERLVPSKAFANNWDTTGTQAPVNQSYALAAGWSPKALNHKTGVLLSANYNNSRRTDFQQRAEYTDDLTPLYEYNDTYHRQNVSWGTMLRVGQKIGTRHKVNASTTFTANAQYNVGLREGLKDPLSNGNHVRSLALYTVNNQLLNSEVNGEHALTRKNIKVRWNAGYGNLQRTEPDYRRINYTRNMEPQHENDTLFLAAIPVGNADQNLGGRFFSNLEEHIYNAGAGVTVPFMLLGQKQSFKAGASYQERDRVFNARMLGYVKYSATLFGSGELSATEILSQDPGSLFDTSNISKQGLLVSDITSAMDRYVAGSELRAGYAMFDNQVNSRTRVVWGVRLEQFSQHLYSNEHSGDTVIVERGPNDSTGYNLDVLPSLNVIYSINKNSNLRFALSKTVSRPEFRELAPFAFYDFTISASVRGNPHLLRTSIYNADVRYEIYPGQGRMIAGSVFYKRFINAVEQVVDQSSSGGSRSRSFENANHADNFGVELEARQNLAVLDKLMGTRALKDLTVNANLAIIRSEVRLDSVTAGRSTRALQGQSPYVLNAGLTYLPEKGNFSASLLFNVIGRRIHEVGTFGYPDVYEAPRPVLDFQVSRNVLRNGNLKFTVSDLFHKPAVFYQDRNESGRYEEAHDSRIQLTRTAMSCGLTFGYKF